MFHIKKKKKSLCRLIPKIKMQVRCLHVNNAIINYGQILSNERSEIPTVARLTTNTLVRLPVATSGSSSTWKFILDRHEGLILHWKSSRAEQGRAEANRATSCVFIGWCLFSPGNWPQILLHRNAELARLKCFFDSLRENTLDWDVSTDAVRKSRLTANGPSKIFILLLNWCLNLLQNILKCVWAHSKVSPKPFFLFK